MNKILITGANGQLGSEFRDLANDYAKYSFFFANRTSADITNTAALESIIATHKIDTIINCAAYTNVDKAESEPDLADSINHKAVVNLAQMCKNHQICLIHISTDYVFNGRSYKPLQEGDSLSPLGIYGITKARGEQAMLAINPSHSLIIRTSWVYSTYGHNFVKTILRLATQRDELNVVFDQVGTPTYARDLAKAILEILPQTQNKNTQIYHYSNEGVTSWYDFTKAIIHIANLPCLIRPIESKDYPTPTERPHYSVLNKAKIKQDFGISIPYWYDSLKLCLQRLKEQK